MVPAAKVGAKVMLEFVKVRAVRVDTVARARLIVIVYLVLEPSDA